MSEAARRSLAAIWFAVAGVIPVAFYFLLFWQGDWRQFTASFLLLFVGAPMLIAALSGFSLGSGILDADEIKTPVQAMLRGLAVALISYLLFFTTSALVLALNNDEPLEFLLGWAIFFLFGFIYVGWLIAIVGVLAGWLLYFYRLKRFDKQS